ncbi:C-type lysozyme, inhibitor [Halomonas denitrificans]|uniref:C-type lysozyme, inhibitor n=1 Tax=Halomonas TaxID=2745 RepID=UPI001C9839EE|nr:MULTISPECIES: C-type lysozyme, inhibitor [Halomonas]MBY5929452.1 C-type lysozyme, inhibitor [Halomonas sp. DP8Y7-3]MBY5983850.1 C-type lysozyme, inhibitor [Halomonas sp. DP5Y7-2]MBY6028569.1 C-type lysozyme, inhibitor [Halomonas sp. DP8Y7-1]MCA0975651.1 C-type lysozyme, inhibitor [Halomonas denitrificans]
MRRSVIASTLLTAALAGLAGCASQSGQDAGSDQAPAVERRGSFTDAPVEQQAPLLPSAYFVGDGTTFVGWHCTPRQDVVTATQGDSLRLWTTHGAEQLPQAVVDQGERYQQGELSAHVIGDRAVIKSGRGRLQCEATARRDSLRRTDKPGVMFYARGNEPGWHLSLANDVPRIDMSLDYGEREASLPYRVTTLDNEAGRVILQSGRADAPFELRIESGACFDDMAGTPWPAQVTLTVNGQQLQGCGQGIAP